MELGRVGREHKTDRFPKRPGGEVLAPPGHTKRRSSQMIRIGSVVAIALALMIGLLAGCSSDNGTDSNDDDSVNLELLEGTWEGSVTFVRDGDCQIEGEDTLYIQSTTQDWTVDPDGSVTIGEDHFYSSWTGKVWPALGVELVKINDWTHGDGASCVCVQYDTTEYIGQVVRTADGGFSLNLISTENWCPASNCTFRVEYDLAKE
jgi:hypothetical protein